ncbi:hypothetical protein NE236_39020 [Actinoallomurus purpureus]|uniref:hypothetical protein n=1 Tax=Actinoallomurus purpureus TaxID=478114 RepID=UPI002092829C|nr:hypothetical protein [Actinoallomurus purpureus]MCO6010967.1 hypothetical protein [Actinoallomurus purpureus]
MRAATTRTASQSRRSIAVHAAVGSALVTALMAAPAYASGTPNVYGKARASTATVPSQSGGSTWVQTDPLTFNHALTGADRADEHISEVPALKIPFPGVWEVSYHARPIIQPTTNAPLYVRTALFKNGTRIRSSEAVTGIAGPNQLLQASAGQTFTHAFAAGDVVTLHASRIGQAGHASVASNDDGRTGVMAHWISPGF